tara:strand:+ start:1166 stop:1774 length:609 start_codon:yes stop_codon:yes gene_type:complete
MKVVNFVANNGSQSVEGALILGKTKSEIIFDTLISNFKNTVIKERNIQNVNNFIASLFARFDTDKLFDYVTVEDTNVEIKREDDKKTKTVFAYKNGDTLTLLPSNTVEVLDINGNPVTIELDVTEMEIEENFEYTKDPLLNRILKANSIPADYNRELNNKILKAVKKIKTGKVNRDTLFLDKYGRITSYARSKYITVSRDMF